jgi:hypothetical protein
MTGGVGDSLRVDPELLGRLGNDLQSAAEDLPDAPPPFVVTGADAISQAISEKLPGIEGPIQEALPHLKSAATTTASNIVTASGMYQSTDEQLAANYQKHQFDQGAPGAGGAGSGAGGGGGGSDAMSQMGQMMSMPMQMASQAAQMPMKAMSAVTSLPQTAVQGVQQIGQMTGGMGKSDGQSGGEPGADQPQDRHDEDQPKHDPQQGAAPGESKGERAPEPKTGGGLHSATPAEPHVPQQGSPKHAVPDPTVNL